MCINASRHRIFLTIDLSHSVRCYSGGSSFAIRAFTAVQISRKNDLLYIYAHLVQVFSDYFRSTVSSKHARHENKHNARVMKVKDFSRVIILLLSWFFSNAIQYVSFSLSPPLPLLFSPPHIDTQSKLQGKAEIVREDHDKTKEPRRRTERRARGRGAMTLLSRTWIRSRLSLSTEWKWRTLLASLAEAREVRRDNVNASSLISCDFNKTHSCLPRFTSALGLCLLIHVFPLRAS